jgi:predicted sugar kinase
MLPALAERDLDSFGEALYDYNRRCGAFFAPWQGGLFAHPRVAEVIAALRSARIKGVGQSSWGPTVFAIVLAEQAAEVAQYLLQNNLCTPAEILVTSVSSGGRASSAEEPRT